MGVALSSLQALSTHPSITQWKPVYQFPDDPVEQDMTAPLSHYFISSGACAAAEVAPFEVGLAIQHAEIGVCAGHNSYLTSDQVIGAAGTSTIVKVSPIQERGARI
jgi:hypothetical protein